MPTDTQADPRPRASSAAAIGVVTAVAVVAVSAVMVAARLLPERGEAEAAVPERIAAGETVRGVLQGAPAPHAFAGTAGQTLTIELRGEGQGLDPYLRLLGPSGEVLGEDDDGGGNLDSRLRITLEEDGEHIIMAGGLDVSRGAYRLSVAVRHPADVGPSEVLVDEQVLTGPGQQPATVTFEVPGHVAATITVHPAAAGADPYIRLFDADRNLLGEDDDGGGDLAARLELDLAGGTHHLEVESLTQGPTPMSVRVEVELPRA